MDSTLSEWPDVKAQLFFARRLGRVKIKMEIDTTQLLKEAKFNGSGAFPVEGNGTGRHRDSGRLCLRAETIKETSECRIAADAG